MMVAPWLLSSALAVAAPGTIAPHGASAPPLETVTAVRTLAAPVAAGEPLAIAQAQFARGDYPGAIATLSSALDANPQDARLLHWRSRCYLEQQDYVRAMTDGERAVVAHPLDSEYRRWLGRAYGAAAEQARSMSLARKVRLAFEAAVRLDPSNVAARRDLSSFYLEAPWIVGGGGGKAWAQVTAIAQIDTVAGHLARAAYARHVGRDDEAEADYARVLALQPTRTDPYFEVADFYESRGDAGTLTSVVERAAAIEPADVRLSYYRGIALVLAQRDPTDAQRLLRTYLSTAPRRSDLPSHASACEWLGRLHERLGQTTAAAESYRAALALDADRDSARAALRRLEAASRAEARAESRAGGRPASRPIDRTGSQTGSRTGGRP